MENHGGMMTTAKNLDSSTTVIWQSYQQSRVIAKQE
jgi:hypothetical protein